MPLHGSSALIGGRYVVSHLGELLVTGETADTYHVGSDGDLEMGMAKSHDTRATAGTTDIDVPHYAFNTIHFTAPDTITDTNNGLATFLDADRIVVRGTTLNDGEYTIAGGGGGAAGTITVTAGITTEDERPVYISIAKRAALSNNVVYDRVTGLLWARYPTSAVPAAPSWGEASDGKLCWAEAATQFALHAANTDLTIVVPNTLRIENGEAELPAFTVGDVIVCSGFANPVNDYTGYVITAVVVNSPDLDITLDPSNHTLIGEVGINASISLCCRSAFAFAAGANVAGLGGYYDGWRVPNITEMHSLLDFSLSPVTPAVGVFDDWPYDGDGGNIWTSTTDPTATTDAYVTGALDGTFVAVAKDTMDENVVVVRLG